MVRAGGSFLQKWLSAGGEIQYCKSPQIFKDQPDGQVTFLYALHVKLQRWWYQVISWYPQYSKSKVSNKGNKLYLSRNLNQSETNIQFPAFFWTQRKFNYAWKQCKIIRILAGFNSAHMNKEWQHLHFQ